MVFRGTYSGASDASEKEANTSISSAYYTPDETLQKEHKNEGFLNKLSKCIDQNEVEALENSFVLDEFQSEVEAISGEEGVLETLVSKMQHNLDLGNNQTQITLSSDSDEEVENLNFSSGSIVIISDDSYIDGNEEDNDNLRRIKIEDNSPRITSYIDKNLDKSKSPINKTNDSTTDEDNYDGDSSNAHSETSLDIVKKSKSTSICSEMNVSLNNSSLSQGFDDTLEEMEMALKQGLDYVMPETKHALTNNTIAPSSIPKLKHMDKAFLTQKKLDAKRLNADKYGYVQSPIGDYIKQKSPNPNQNVFKKPLPTRCTTPNCKTTSLIPAPTKYFKDIVSPVAVYIKNNPAIQKTNVPIRTVSEFPEKNEVPKMSNKENVQFPPVIYKKSKNTVTTEIKEIVLPKSIQKMVQESTITKHEMRIQKHLNDTACNKKLLEDDLTITNVDGSLLNATQDISFHTKKQAFM